MHFLDIRKEQFFFGKTLKQIDRIDRIEISSNFNTQSCNIAKKIKINKLINLNTSGKFLEFVGYYQLFTGVK